MPTETLVWGIWENCESVRRCRPDRGPRRQPHRGAGGQHQRSPLAARDGFKIFQLYVRGDTGWVDDHVRRAIDNGYDAFCLTIDTDSYSRRERDIAKRHQRRRVPVDDARIHQAQFNWRDIERIKKNFDIPLVLKGISTAEDTKIAVESTGSTASMSRTTADASSIKGSARSMSCRKLSSGRWARQEGWKKFTNKRIAAYKRASAVAASRLSKRR